MVVNNETNLNIYPENRPFKFRTYLQTPLLLKSKWKVAIIDINLSQGQQSQALYVYSDICARLLWMEALNHCLNAFAPTRSHTRNLSI